MNIELELENDYEKTEQASVELMLEEGTISRDSRHEDGITHEDKFDRKFSPAEDNDADVATSEESADIEIEERTAGASSFNSVKSNDTHNTDPKTEKCHAATDQNTPQECTTEIIPKIDFYYPPVHSYKRFNKEQKHFIMYTKKLMAGKFHAYNDFLEAFAAYNADYLADSRCFLFYHLLFTMEKPIEFLYLLNFDSFNDNPIMSGPCDEIIDFWKYLKKL